MSRIANALVLIAFAVGMLQYIPIVIEGIASGNISIFALSEEQLADVGPSRYLKDIYLLLFSLAWPVLVMRMELPTRFRRLLAGYALWIFAILVLGILPYAYANTPPFIFIAGLRWLVLLHASVGAFVMMIGVSRGMGSIRSSLPLWPLIVLLALNLSVAGTQFFVSGASVFGFTRVTGLFGNAGVLAALAIGFAMVALCHQEIRNQLAITFIAGCWLIAALSGSRYALLAVTTMFITRLFLPTYLARKAYEKFVYMAVLLLIIPIASVFGYQALVEFADRGDLIGTQLEEGGRIVNLHWILDQISEANISEILFGSGLGVGTNSAFILCMARGIVPEHIRFNWLIDNGFVTLFFQVGLIGTVVFWLGFSVFVRVCMRSISDPKSVVAVWIINGIFFIGMIAGNFFEQIYLMLSYLVALGFLVAYSTPRNGEQLEKPQHNCH